jgi:hypothetical protein
MQHPQISARERIRLEGQFEQGYFSSYYFPATKEVTRNNLTQGRNQGLKWRKMSNSFHLASYIHHEAEVRQKNVFKWSNQSC